MAEKTQGSDLTFEDRINEVLDKRLRDQTTLPAEFRSWLPRFIEIQNIQLPVSQVTGANLTGTDVDSLGGDVHGRVGMIRGGVSPYDFTQLTFDAVYDKWVSDETPILQSSFATSHATSSTTYGETQPPHTEAVLAWEAFDLTGLKPQFRILTRMQTSNVLHVASLSLRFKGGDSGAAFSAGTDASWAATTTSIAGGGVMVDSGWNDVPAAEPVKDFLLLFPVAKVANGASTATIYAFHVHLRWVSA